ncbi:hypothetical protein SEA_ORCANUS_28 [Arthrobacter phage Orcanus]|nr:hypothetical protein SEA_ORCANUS_28 [Arthrobacter phage Orcanus]
METYTTTAAGRTIELEIVQNAPAGYAVNFHQLADCIGHLEFSRGGFTVTTDLGTFGERLTLGEFADRFEALGALVAHLAGYLERLEDVEEPATHDPADAAEMVMDALNPEVYGEHYGWAAIRDICRRAAYDMGIIDRRAHTEMLPVIAKRATDMIRAEFAPQILEAFLQDLADVLEAQGWSANSHRTSYEHRAANASFDLAISEENIKVYAARPHSTVETFSLDRAHTSADRAARIILAIFA